MNIFLGFIHSVVLGYAVFCLCLGLKVVEHTVEEKLEDKNKKE